jgi:hypothetical protein
MSALLNLGDKITAGNRADATFFYKKRVLADSGTLLTEAETDANNRELLAQSLFDKASVVYTAGGVKASKAYSVKGTDFTVTRAGVKNVIGRDGLLTEIPANTPATEFSNGVLKGTLIEPARTNLVQRSEEFDNAYWTNAASGTGINPARTANVAIAPDGTQTADRVFFDQGAGVASGDFSALRSANISTTVQSYTGSIWLKADTVDDIGKQLLIRHAGAAQYGVFTLTADWQRVNRTETGILGNIPFEIGVRTQQGGNAPQVSTLLWGAQLETGSVATSYIKTVDTAITQPADVITATGVSGEIGQTEGAVLVEVDLRNPKQESNGIIALTSAINNDGTNRVAITKGDSKTIGLGIRANDTLVVSIFTVSEWTNGINKIGVRYKSGESAMYVNGVLVGTSVNNFTFTQVLNNVKIGYFFGFPQFFINDSISQALIFKQALTDQEIQTWTTL